MTPAHLGADADAAVAELDFPALLRLFAAVTRRLADVNLVSSLPTSIATHSVARCLDVRTLVRCLRVRDTPGKAGAMQKAMFASSIADVHPRWHAVICDMNSDRLTVYTWTLVPPLQDRGGGTRAEFSVADVRHTVFDGILLLILADLNTGHVLARQTPHVNAVTAVRLHPPSRRLLSAGADGRLFLHSVADPARPRVLAAIAVEPRIARSIFLLDPRPSSLADPAGLFAAPVPSYNNTAASPLLVFATAGPANSRAEVNVWRESAVPASDLPAGRSRHDCGAAAADPAFSLQLSLHCPLTLVLLCATLPVSEAASSHRIGKGKTLHLCATDPRIQLRTAQDATARTWSVPLPSRPATSPVSLALDESRAFLGPPPGLLRGLVPGPPRNFTRMSTAVHRLHDSRDPGTAFAAVGIDSDKNALVALDPVSGLCYAEITTGIGTAAAAAGFADGVLAVGLDGNLRFWWLGAAPAS
ncbi:hypothetical protein HK405_004881 [Cladochytrium tenue]|nr:hypothetical protein HK405_004881 [Cladochytrium tenue]